jgi:hypothetical protein
LSAESVSVADLLARTTPEEQAIVSAIQERAAAEATTKAAEEVRDQAETTPAQLPAVIDPAPPGNRPQVSRRVTRTIMVATAAMLVCGAVTVFSVLTTTRSPVTSPSTPTVGPVEITGPAVVRPDQLNQLLAAGLPTSARSNGNTAAGGLVPDDDVHVEQLIRPVMVGGSLANPRTEEISKIIYNFYTLAPETPGVAFELLGPEMQGDGKAGFEKCWQTDNVDTKLLVQVNQLMIGPGGVVRAIVAISWPDATFLWTDQLLVISEGPDPKIIRAELLSAHRS